FSSKSLKVLFDRHIDKTAKVTTDKWRGYRPISKQYNIEQIESDKGKNFLILHTMIHQVKSWIRTIYSWVSKKHIQRYFNEFCY
ncbi:MAG: transposase, partial [Tenacibaculum sp.]